MPLLGSFRKNALSSPELAEYLKWCLKFSSLGVSGPPIEDSFFQTWRKKKRGHSGFRQTPPPKTNPTGVSPLFRFLPKRALGFVFSTVGVPRKLGSFRKAAAKKAFSSLPVLKGSDTINPTTAPNQ